MRQGKDPSRSSIRRLAHALTFTGLLCAAVLSLSLSSAGAAPASGTKTFASTGVPETFSVPDGVTKIHVLAVGAHAGGGQFPGGDGGFGGTATADVPVSPGQVLYVVVGGGGGGGCCGSGGGFNGGGVGGSITSGDSDGGGGGGASDVRTMSFSLNASSLASRLIVAGGGGGGGGNSISGHRGLGGAGGDAGAPGVGTVDAGPGTAGTPTTPGTGGLGDPLEASGYSGDLGIGGGGGDGIGGTGGGGGGGGFYGGGGGAGGGQDGSGGGGGGSSGFAVTASNTSVGTDTTAVPLVRISYSPGEGGTNASKSGLKFGKPKLNEQKGTALLPVTVPGSGTLSIGGKGVVRKRPGFARASVALAKAAPQAGTYKLKVKTKGAKKTKLFDTGKVKVKAVVTFEPTSGDAVVATDKIKLKKN